LIALLSHRRASRATVTRSCRPALEGLEQRWVPTNVITPANVIAVQTGTLLTLSTDQNNDGAAIIIAPKVNGIPGSFTVSDGNTTTTISVNGGIGQQSHDFVGNITQIQVNLLGGDGSVNVTGGVFLKGQLQINLAGGTNQVTLSSGAEVGSLKIGSASGSTGTDTISVLQGFQVMHNLKIDTSNSSGPSTITVGDYVHVGGNLNVKAGSGEDSLTLGRLFVGGSVGVNFSVGTTTNTFTADTGGQILGNLVYFGGAGVDNINLGGRLNVGGNVSLFTQAGADQLQLGSGLIVDKSMNVFMGKDSNTAALQGLTIVGGLGIFDGGGKNSVDLSDDWVNGALLVGLGNGNNTVTVDDTSASKVGSEFNGAATFSTGTGTNSIQVGGANPVIFGGPVLMSSNSVGAIGNPSPTGTTFTIDDSTFLNNLTLKGGSGNDNVNIATRTTTAGVPTQVYGQLYWVGGGGHYTVQVGVTNDPTRALFLAHQPITSGTTDHTGTEDVENLWVAGVQMTGGKRTI